MRATGGLIVPLGAGWDWLRRPDREVEGALEAVPLDLSSHGGRCPRLETLF